MIISGTVYKCDCDDCQKEERDKSKVLNWLSVRVLRDEIAPVRGCVRWRRDFCSPDCLIDWMRTTPGYLQMEQATNET